MGSQDNSKPRPADGRTLQRREYDEAARRGTHGAILDRMLRSAERSERRDDITRRTS